MMLSHRLGLLAVAVVLSPLAHAEAGPINLIVKGFDGREEVSSYGTLPTDISKGYMQIIEQEQIPIPAAVASGAVDPGSFYMFDKIDSDVQVRLYFSPDGSTVPLEDLPSLLVKGHVSGFFAIQNGIQDIDTNLSGSGSIVQAFNWTPDAQISQGMLEQILKFSDFEIRGFVDGGHSNDFALSLFAFPTPPGTPSPTPEPTTLAFFATSSLGMILAKRFRNRS